MAQEIINIGALPNDGSGDPMRVAFAKVNNNFSALFTESSASGPDGSIQYNTLTIGSGAEVESIVLSEAVVDFNIINPGSGYKTVNPPIVSITPAFGDLTGFGASAQAIITNGELTGLALISGGSGYTLPPIVTISDTENNEFNGSTKLIFDSTNNVLSTGVDIIPQVDSFYNIGNTDYRFGSIYLNGEGIFLGNVLASESGNVLTFSVTANSAVKSDFVIGNLTAANITGNSVTVGNTEFNYTQAETYGTFEQVIFSIPSGTFLSGKFNIYSAEANTVNTQTTSITGTKSGDGTSIKYTVTETTYGNQPVITNYVMDVQGGDIVILVTQLAEEETVNHKITYQKVV